MSTKGSSCSHCCCSQCGVSLPKGLGTCCLCVCDELCVEVEGEQSTADCLDTNPEGVCGCSSTGNRVVWDPDVCAYVGTLVCGALTIDVRFDVKTCEEGCYLCLTSECLGLAGTCPQDCRLFEPGNKSGDCGHYIRDCDQLGGWDATWTVDASGCGDVDCTSVTITAKCLPRINPTATGQDKLCKDCDCVCEYLCVTYSESGGLPGDECLSQSKRVPIEGSSFTATFECEQGSQTVTVEMVRHPETGCCWWRPTFSRGTLILAPIPLTDQYESPEVKTVCPEVDLEWQVQLTEEGHIGTFTAVCEQCNGCGETFCCCPNDVQLPSTLTASLFDEDGCCECADGKVITLEMVDSSTTQFGGGGRWEGTGSVCGVPARVILRCNNEEEAGCMWQLKLCFGPKAPCTDTLDDDCDSMDWIDTPPIGGACSGIDACCDPLYIPFPTGTSFNMTCACNGPFPCTPGIDGQICVIVTE